MTISCLIFFLQFERAAARSALARRAGYEEMENRDLNDRNKGKEIVM